MTNHYSFIDPEESDSMAAGPSNLNFNWSQIDDAVAPPIEVGPNLPESYNVGQRIYFEPHRSIYLCTGVDIYWGHIWRPVQACISPWVNIPDEAIINSNYHLHPVNPLQYALDNKGFAHFRGALENTSGIDDNNSLTIFKTFPQGLRNSATSSFSLALSPVDPSILGRSAMQVGRIYIRYDGYNSVRFQNSGSSTEIWFDGLMYSIGEGFYWGA